MLGFTWHYLVAAFSLSLLRDSWRVHLIPGHHSPSCEMVCFSFFKKKMLAHQCKKFSSNFSNWPQREIEKYYFLKFCFKMFLFVTMLIRNKSVILKYVFLYCIISFSLAKKQIEAGRYLSQLQQENNKFYLMRKYNFILRHTIFWCVIYFHRKVI